MAVPRIDNDVGATVFNNVEVVTLVTLLDHFISLFRLNLEHGVQHVGQLVLLEVLEQNVADHHRSQVLHRIRVLRHNRLLVGLGFVDILPPCGS